MSRKTARLEPGNCLCAGLRKASRAITQLYDNELRASGIRSTQFAILAAIHQAGEANVSQLTERLLLDQTTLTRGLRLLEQMRLLQKVPKQDARVKTLKLTPHGVEVLRSATMLWRNAQARVVKAFPENQLAEVQGLLEALINVARPDR